MRALALARREQPAVAPRGALQRVGGGEREVRPRAALSSRRDARASPAIASAFHDVRILSSRPGRCRRSRAANSFARAESRRACASGSAMPQSRRDLRRAASRRAGSTRGLRSSAGRRDRSAARRRRIPPRTATRAPRRASRRRTCPPRPRCRHRGSSRTRRRPRASRASARRRSRRAARSNAARRSRRARSAYSAEQRPVVVEHLLEVRDLPLRDRPNSGRSRRPADRGCRLPPSVEPVERTIGSAPRSPAARHARTAQSCELGHVRELRRAAETRRAARSKVVRISSSARVARIVGQRRAGSASGSRLASARFELVALRGDRRRPSRDRRARRAAAGREIPAARNGRPSGNRCRRRTDRPAAS